MNVRFKYTNKTETQNKIVDKEEIIQYEIIPLPEKRNGKTLFIWICNIVKSFT